VDGQIDSIQVAVQQQGLLGVEGEPTQDVTELGALRALRHSRHRLSDPAGDDLIGFDGRTGSEQRVEGEDAAWRMGYLRRKDSLDAAEE
jgi:hypothetical protein